MRVRYCEKWPWATLVPAVALLTLLLNSLFMKKFLSLLVGWLAGLLLLGCNEEAPEPELELPPITLVGANIMGFEVDGRVWVNYGRGCYGSGGGGCFDNVLRAQSSVYRGVRRFSLSAGLLTPRHQEDFALSIDTLRGTGTYSAGPLPSSFPSGAVGTGANGISLSEGRRHLLFVSRTNATRIVLTRVDTVAHIISGTFEGRLEDGFNPGTFATIRNGRFDMTY